MDSGLENVMCYGDVIYVEGIFGHASDEKLLNCHDQKLLYTDCVYMKRSSICVRKHEPEFKNISKYLYQIVNTSELTKMGSQLRFGTSFALMPVKQASYRSFLSVREGERADMESDCQRLTVTSTVDTKDPLRMQCNQFRLRSTAIYRSNGPVYYSDLVSIQSVSNPSLFMHIGDTKSTYGAIDLSCVEKGYNCQIEVNASTKSEDEIRGSFNWKFHQYDRLSHLYGDGHTFRIGSYIRLHQSSTNKYLCCSAKLVSREVDVDHNKKDPYVLLKDPYLRSYDDDEILTPKTIFRVEGEDVMKGGTLSFGQKCRLRHILTGGYLCLTFDEEDLSKPPKIELAKLPSKAYKIQAVVDEFLKRTTCQFVNVTNRMDSANIMLNDPVVYIQFSYILHADTANPREVKFILSDSVSYDWSCKLYPDITTDIPGPLMTQLHASEGLELTSKKAKIRTVCVNDAKISTDLTICRDYDSVGPDEVISSYELLKGCVFAMMLTSGTEVHMMSAIQESHPYLDDLELNVLALHSHNRQRGNAVQDVIIKPDSAQQVMGNLFSIKAFMTGQFDHLFDHAATGSSASRSIVNRMNMSSLLTESQKQRKIYRNQIFIKDCGFVQRWFAIIRLPRILGIPWARILQNSTMKDFFIATYECIAAVAYRNGKVQHYIARARYDYTNLILSLPSSLGIDVEMMQKNSSSKGFLREIFDQLRLHLGGVQVIKSVLTDDYDIFVNLVNKKLIDFIYYRLRDGRRALVAKARSSDDVILTMGEENLHTMTLLTNILSSRKNYCPQNQELVLKNVYLPYKVEFFIESCLLASTTNNTIAEVEDYSSNNIILEKKYGSSTRIRPPKRQSITSPYEIYLTWSGLQYDSHGFGKDKLLSFGVEHYLHDTGFAQLQASPKNYLDDYLDWIEHKSAYDNDHEDVGLSRRDSTSNYSKLDVDHTDDSCDAGASFTSRRSHSQPERPKDQHHWVRLQDILDIVTSSSQPNVASGSGLSVTPRGMDIMKNKERELLRQKLEMLLKNYQNALDLMASLCESRNHACISHISKQFSFELLTHGISNRNLPFALRSHYGRLIRVLYIDRFPYVDLKLPLSHLCSKQYDHKVHLEDLLVPCSRINQNISLLDATIMSSNSITEDKKRMEQLQSVISNFFNEYFGNGDIDGEGSMSGSSISFPISLENPQTPAGFSFILCSFSLLKLLHIIIRSGNYKRHSSLSKILRIIAEVLRTQVGFKLADHSVSNKISMIVEKQKLALQSARAKYSSDKRKKHAHNLKADYALIDNDDDFGTGNQVDNDKDDDDEYNADLGYDVVEDLSKERLKLMCSAHDANIGVNTSSIKSYTNQNVNLSVLVKLVEVEVWDKFTSTWVSPSPANADSTSRFHSKDESMAKLLLTEPSFDVHNHSKGVLSLMSSSTNHGGLPDLTWYWVDEWHPAQGVEGYYPSDSNTEYGTRERTWIRNRQRKEAWAVAEDLNRRGHSWFEILSAFKMFQSTSDMVDLRNVVVSLHEVSLSTDFVYSESSGSSLDHIEKVLMSSHFHDTLKTRIVAVYRDSCVNAVLSIYDINTYYQGADLVQQMYSQYTQAVRKLSFASTFTTTNDEVISINSSALEIFSAVLNDDKAKSLDILHVTSPAFMSNVFALILHDNHNRCGTAVFLLRRQFFKTKLFVQHATALKLFDVSFSDVLDDLGWKFVLLENEVSLMFKPSELPDDSYKRVVQLLQHLVRFVTKPRAEANNRPAVEGEENPDNRRRYCQYYQEIGLTDYLFKLVVLCYNRRSSVRSAKTRSAFEVLTNLVTDIIVELLDNLAVMEKFALIKYIDDLIDNMSRHYGSIRIIKAMTDGNRWMIFNSPMKKLITTIFTVISSSKRNEIASIPDCCDYLTVCQRYQWHSKVSILNIWDNIKTSFDTHASAQVYYASLFFSKKFRRIRNELPGGDTFDMTKVLNDLDVYGAGNGGKLISVSDTSIATSVDVNMIPTPDDHDLTNHSRRTADLKSKAQVAYSNLATMGCLLETLSLCCIGGTVDQRTVAVNKSRVKDEIPVEYLLQILDHAVTNRHLPLIRGLLCLLYSAHFEGPTSDIMISVKEFVNVVGIWSSLARLMDIAQIFALNRPHGILPNSSDGFSLELLVVEYILPFCSILFYEIENISIDDESYNVRFTGYSSMRIRLFHILELVCVRPTSQSTHAAYEHLKALLIELQPTIEHENGFAWTLKLHSTRVDDSPIYINEKKQSSTHVLRTNSMSGGPVTNGRERQPPKRSFIEEFVEFQHALPTDPAVIQQTENDMRCLLDAVMLECDLMDMQGAHARILPAINHDAKDDKKYALLHRLIRFAREEVDLKLSTWPKGEKRRQAIKPGDYYTEIQSVQMIFDILTGIISRYHTAEHDGDGSNTHHLDHYANLTQNHVHHQTTSSSSRLIKVIDILVNANVLNLVIETMANCCYKDLVFRAIRLGNDILAYGAPVKIQHHFYLILTGIDSRDRHLEHKLDSGEVDFDDNARLYFECFHDRIYLANYIRRLAHESIASQLDAAYAFGGDEDQPPTIQSTAGSSASTSRVQARQPRLSHVSSTSYAKLPGNDSSVELTSVGAAGPAASKKVVFSADDNTSKRTAPVQQLATTSTGTTSNHKLNKGKRALIVDGINAATQSAEFIDSISSIRNVLIMLQLICANSFHPFQALMHNEECKIPFSLLGDVVNFLETMLPSSKLLAVLRIRDIEIISLGLKFIKAASSGPNTKNQTYLFTTTFLSVLKSILHYPIGTSASHIPVLKADGSDFDERFISIINLRLSALQVLMHFIEGRIAHPKCPVYRPLIESFSLDIFARRLSDIQHIVSGYIPSLASKNRWSHDRIQATTEWMTAEAYPILTLYRYVADAQPHIMRIIEPHSNKMMDSLKHDMFFSRDKDVRIISRQRYREESNYQRVYNFFSSRLRSIEVRWGEQGLTRLYYRVPEECLLLSKDDFDYVKQRLDFGDDDRVPQLFAFADELKRQTSHYSNLKRWDYKALFMFQAEADIATFINSIIINIVLLLSISQPAASLPEHRRLQDEHHVSENGVFYEPYGFFVLVRILTIIQFILTSSRFIQGVILRYPVLFHSPNIISKHDTSKVHMHSSTLMTNADGNHSHNVDGNTQKASLTIRNFILHFVSTFALACLCILIIAFVDIAFDIIPVPLIIFCALATGIHFLFRLRSFGKFLSHDISLRTGVLQGILYRYCVFWDTLWDENVKYKFAFFVVATVCLDMDLFYFNPFILFLIVRMSTTLQNVLKSVTISGRQLIMTCIFLTIGVLTFTMFAFTYIHESFINEHFNRNDCDNLLECFITMMYGGVINTGGIKDFFVLERNIEPNVNYPTSYASRIVFDFMFFAVINILTFNMILGTIIDTFASVRDETSHNRKLKKSYCFICHLPKEAFASVSTNKGTNHTSSSKHHHSFSDHRRRDHNMWNYLFFLIYLMGKPGSSLNNIERYIVEQWKDGELAWIPRNECLALMDMDVDDNVGVIDEHVLMAESTGSVSSTSSHYSVSSDHKSRGDSSGKSTGDSSRQG